MATRGKAPILRAILRRRKARAKERKISAETQMHQEWRSDNVMILLQQ